MRHSLPPFVIGLAALAAAGCGGSKHSPALAQTPATKKSPTTPAASATAPSSPAPSALQAESKSAATGDVPDNQVYLVLHNRRAGYSIKYPEGWAETGSGNRIVFRDKNNIVRIVLGKAARPSIGQVRTELRRLRSAHVTEAPSTITLKGTPAIKAVYTTESRPNPVTGKRVTLVVDRYYLAHAGKRAIVDLGTPQGVDNVDAYRLMIESFRWR